MFGSFIKFIVTSTEASDSDADKVSHSKRRRLDVLTEKSFPSYISPEKNKKDKLYNTIVKKLSEKNLGWMDPLKYGKPFVVDLCNLLWFIDGHHDVFASRSCPIPLFFSTFVGYNRPELSKHRRRSVSNMSRDKLLEHAATLQEHATSSWIQQPEWRIFKDALIKLIESISSYAAYLAIRCQATSFIA